MKKNNKYNLTSERLWEKLEFHRDELDLTCVDFSKPFPIDQLAAGNSNVPAWINEVQDEFDYGMSEFQCSWAVSQMIKGGVEFFDVYNKKQGTDLRPRA